MNVSALKENEVPGTFCAMPICEQEKNVHKKRCFDNQTSVFHFEKLRRDEEKEHLKR